MKIIEEITFTFKETDDRRELERFKEWMPWLFWSLKPAVICELLLEGQWKVDERKEKK